MTEIKEDLNILQYATQYDVKHSTSILESIKFLMHDGKSSNTAIIFLNKQLANAATRELAFDILLKILPDCSKTLLEENAKTWANYAVSKHQSEVIAACKFKFLVELYHKCHSNQDFYKTIVTNLLTKIIDTCLWVHGKSPEAENSLHCLFYTMKYFSTACVVHKRKIEEYVLQFLDLSSKIAVTSRAAKCFHILNQIGGAGPNGSIHVKNYEDNFEKLFKTLTVLYDAMFENINEFREASSTEDELNVIQFKQVPTYLSTMDVYKILNRRMGNVVVFLIEMLQTNYNVKKTIKPEILEVIQRGLDIHIHGDENDPNRVLFNQCIQEHQIKLLFLLKALIQSLQHNFMRHLTIKMLVRYLARVSDCTCYQINSLYKSTIYNVIKYWLESSGEQIDSKTYEKLVEIIIKDITPDQTTLVLQINVNENKSKGTNKQKNKKEVQAQATQPNNKQVSPRVIQTNIENCLAALELLETMLKCIRLNIKKSTCAQLFDVITRSLLDVCVNTFVCPYTSKPCRSQLFKVLIAIFDQNTYTIDIDLAVNILSLAQRGDDIELSVICNNGLKVIEKIVHPIQPTMCIRQDNVPSVNASQETDEANKEKSTSITVLSNLLIAACGSEDGQEAATGATPVEEDGSKVDNTTKDDKEKEDAPVALVVPQETVNGNNEKEMEESSGSTREATRATESILQKRPSTKKNDVATDATPVVEIISDNDGEEGDGDGDISIIDQDGYPIPTKKRKANDSDIIFTFDISEDPMDSFVDKLK